MARTKQTARRNTGGKSPRNPGVKLKTKVRAKTTPVSYTHLTLPTIYSV